VLNGDVVTALVSNDGADISEATMQTVLDEFGEVERINEPMARRATLPMAVAERLVNLVSETLQEHLVAKHDLPPELASDLVLQSRERATLGLLSPDTNAMQLHELVSQLNENGRLTSTIILRALCLGDIDFFETAMSVLSRLPLGSARALIHDERPLGLRAISGHAGMPDALYPAFRSAIDVIHENEFDGGENDRERFRRRMIERILTHVADPSAEIGADNAEYLLAKLAQIDPGVIRLAETEPA
jgi:uncharacterized protein (DUF2336 family)